MGTPYPCKEVSISVSRFIAAVKASRAAASLSTADLFWLKNIPKVLGKGSSMS